MAFPVKPEAAVASRIRNILQDMQPIFNSNDLLSFWDIDRKLKTLGKTLKRIQDVLNDAEWRSQTEGSVSDWMDDLRELLYCIEDFLDDMNIERVQIEKQLAALNQAAYTAQEQLAELNQAIRSCEYASQKQLEALYKLESQAASLYTLGDIMADCTPKKKTISESIKKIIGSLVEVAKDATELNLKPQTFAGTPVASFSTKNGEDIGPLVDESEIYGRQEDKDHVIKLLMNPNSSRNYSVVSIVGMGGVGKTTLARLVFMDVKSHFDMKSWACVSDDFDFSRVVRELIEYISGEKTSKMTTAALLDRLKSVVTARKVLFVLDDMWTVDAWEKLKGAFTRCAKGSKILVTTRDKNIGHAINHKEIYELQTLDDNNCWLLFKEKAFGGVADERLEGIGKRIVARCKGVPLAVKVIGSSLRFAPEEMWEKTLKNKIWQSMDVAKDGIFPVLKLSYHYLPSSLKRCFQYFSVFPTDYWFERENLVRQWIAEGLIESREGGMLEDIGCGYYIELQRRCIIQEDDKMHDLLHSLSCLVSGKFFRRSAKDSKSYTHMRSIRHLSLIDKDVNIEMFDEAACLCTLLVLEQYLLDKINLKWTLLRVLDLSCNHLSELPGTVGDLKHLRYLNLSRSSKLQSLPGSICKLHNLQTLDLSYCYGMSTLPTDMGHLQNLRFLILSEMEYLSALPSSIVKLSNLLTLDLSWCKNLPCIPNKIGGLQSLQRLWLNGCRSISHLQSEIGNLQHLRELQLGGSSISCLPESICNIHNLRVLDISRCESLNSLPCNIGNVICVQKFGRFVVGREEGHGIELLKDMNKLQGELVISCLANVQSVEHALMANLKKKVLDEIHFDWGNEGHESRDSINDLEDDDNSDAVDRDLDDSINDLEDDDMSNVVDRDLDDSINDLEDDDISDAVDRDLDDSINDLEDDDISDVVDRDLEARVLDALEPHPTSLKSLSFRNYRGGRIPKWLSALSFPILKELVMEGLEGINRMVDLELPSLKWLEIKSCLKLKDVSMGVPKLIKLVVLDCQDLTILSISSSLGNSSSSLASSIFDLPQLKELTFRGCSSLRDISMELVPGLEELRINDCKELRMIVDHMPNLRELMLKPIPNLTLPGGLHPGSSSSLTSLKELSISSGCEHELISLAMPFDCEAHGSLESITFSGDQLESRKVASLPCAMKITGSAGQVLPLAGDDEAGSTSSSLPSTLTRLVIQNCPNLTHLPKALFAIASLQTLIISDCPELLSFPETGLPPLLQELRVDSCKNLRYFPTGLNDHTSLREIYFIDCEQVEARPDDGPSPNLFRLSVLNCPKLEQQIKQLRKDWLAKTHFHEDLLNWFDRLIGVMVSEVTG